MAQCISPANLAGGTAFSASFSAGYAGSPGTTTIRYASADGTFGTPNLSLTSPVQAGVTGNLRNQVAVKYNIDSNPAGSVMTVTFQDKGILDLSRRFVVLNDPDLNIPGGACVFPLGRLYHKPLGAPNVADETTLRQGAAPKIKEGNSWRSMGEEYIFYTPADLVGVAGGLISGSLAGVVQGGPPLMSQNGQSVLSIIQSIAGDLGYELYANQQGILDLKPDGGGGGVNVGAGCGIVSVTSSADLTCTKAEGGYVTYKHEAQYRDKKKQRFKCLDLLGLPVTACSGDVTNMFTEDMEAQDLAEMSRALKAGWLDESWNNWKGFSTYVHLKRVSEEAKDPADVTDTVPVFWYPGAPAEWGMNIPEKKKIKQKCFEIGQIPAKLSEHIKKNGVIDILFDCLKPALLNIQEGEPKWVQNQIVANIKELDAGANNAQIDPEKVDVLIVGTKSKLECVGGEFVDGGTIFDDIGNDVNWAEGANADYANVLGEFAKTVGRFWVMGGGGAGGGAGTITKRQHDLREYELPGKGSHIWYHPDTDVRDTVFGQIYEALYAKYIKDKNEADPPGVIVNQDAIDSIGADPVRKPAKHLSISQFIQLAATGKRRAKAGKDPDLGNAFGNGKGKGGAALAADAEDLEKRCNRNEPKGIVIWDKEVRGMAIPEQDGIMKSMAGGLEPYNDRNGNDVVKFLIEQLDVVSCVNNCKNGVGGEKPEGLKNEGDVMDFSLDVYVPHDDWFPGEEKSKKLSYTQFEDRKHYNARARYPGCDDAYSLSVSHQDISGQVLWRKVDCRGTILPWTQDFREHGQVSNALESALNKMSKSETDICKTSQVTTCGDGPANMPGGGATQDYNVTFNEDGSVNTTFTLSGNEARIASQNLQKHNFNAQGPGGKAGNIINPGPNLNDPLRGLRNPRTR